MFAVPTFPSRNPTEFCVCIAIKGVRLSVAADLDNVFYGVINSKRQNYVKTRRGNRKEKKKKAKKEKKK